jgi:hypothetical protein
MPGSSLGSHQVRLCNCRDGRRSHLLHDELKLASQQREHRLNALLSEGAQSQMYGRPIPMDDAPSAMALNTSVPRRNPPSQITGMRPAVPCNTSGSDAIVARIEFSARPPWLEQNNPSAPCSTASSASSRVTMPLINYAPQILHPVRRLPGRGSVGQSRVTKNECGSCGGCDFRTKLAITAANR